MISLGFSVFDRAVKAFLPPFWARSRGEAIRSFSDAVNDQKHQFNTHSGDYSLWYVSAFNDENGVVESIEPERVVTATEVLIPDNPFPPGRQVA